MAGMTDLDRAARDAADRAALALVDDSDIDPQACVSLWAAVLELQINVARGHHVSDNCFYTPQTKARHKAEARSWLLGRDCARICELVSLDHSVLIAEFQAGFPAMQDGALRRVRVREGRAVRQFAIAAE